MNIETKTPLYIRGTLTETEVRNKVAAKDKPDFFAPCGIPRIPGSSLRGMVRNLVEIMSYGKFEFVDDRRLYFRGLADRNTSLQNYYQGRLNAASAGILFKRGMHYFIKRTGFSPIPRADAQVKVTALGANLAEFQHYDLGTHYLVVSGDMQGKNNDWLIDKPSGLSREIEIPDQDVKSYIDDNNRKKNAPHLTELAKTQDVPCFFVTWTDAEDRNRVSFGHTRNFRVAYQATINDHIPDPLKRSDMLDLPGALFGDERVFAGRVFFEDAFLEGPAETAFEDEKTVTLQGPKPTTYQHYLVQSDTHMSGFPRNLAHYDTRPLSSIRGHKLYWHKDTPEYKTSGYISSIDTKLCPMSPNKTFRCRIRFENLSKVELGVLLFALDLPDGCCHKIGMGKPLGLGSVRVTPRLFISKRIDRYRNLFAEWDPPLADSSEHGAGIQDFKKSFEQYVLRQLGEGSAQCLWDLERMKQLEKILRFDNKPSDVKYMELTVFRERKVLPRPTEVR